MKITAKLTISVALILTWLALMRPLEVMAAVIEPHSDPVMGCVLRVSGEITSGDADNLRRALEHTPRINGYEYNRYLQRICFDSPGGSYLEAIDMAKIIKEMSFSTAVGPGAICESACAIAFMAGGSPPQEDWPGTSRILHPSGKLGFHAPNIVFDDREFSRVEVQRAYRIATLAIARLISLRQETSYDFPDSLLKSMLETDPNKMHYITTVRDASLSTIEIWPSSYYLPEDIGKATSNFCFNGLPLHRSYDESWDYSFNTEYYRGDRFEVSNSGHRVEIMTNFRNGVDGGISCELFATFADTSSFSPRVYGFLFDKPYLSFPPDTNIRDISLDFVHTRSEFISRVLDSSQRTSASFETCWLTSSTAGITNVNEYANLRRQPGFSAPIVRRAPLGETVRLVKASSIRVIEAQPGRELCFEACQALEGNPQDTTAAGRVRQCIDDNRLWYEISDTRGNRGWVSRKFLEEVE